MKILLAACNAKYIHSNLAVYNLMAYAKKYKDVLVLREFTINQPRDEIMKHIYRERPDIVCFSCYIWNISFVKELASDLAQVMPETRFWAGGPEVSFDAEGFLSENPAFTGIMVGEGEQTFLELAEHYVEGGRALADILGLVYRDGQELFSTGWREPLDLSLVPFAYETLSDFKNRIIYYESSRGCPFSCSYCLSSVDKRLRFRSLDLVKKELQFFLDHGVPQVKFVDRTFNCKHDHAMAVWTYIRDHDNGITNFHFEISADLLREEELALLGTMRPGLIQLEIGVQSTNRETLGAISRSMDFGRLCQNVETIHGFANIHQHLDLIAGLPYEDYDSFHRSFKEVYALKPQQLQLGFLKVLKGSAMERETGGYGICHKAKEPYEVLCTRWLSYEDVLLLKEVESMVEIYYNSGQFVHTVAYLEGFFPDAFLFYEALGCYYRKKGYGEISHSRIRRYEILLEFAGEHPGIERDVLIEKMLMDLYLREHLKSRPSFAPYPGEWEAAVREYRRREGIPKTAHIEVFSDGRALLFNYEKRDVLHHNAEVQEILIKKTEVK